jgi:hypothetical protein
MYRLLIIVFSLFSFSLIGQDTTRVLFLGNSYTSSNNLPLLFSQVAASAGKFAYIESSAPGGYYLGQHLTNPISLSLIARGNWHYVVLQEQSMALAYPYYYLYGLPSVFSLDSLISAQNVCAQTMLYSTWGRKNGDSYICNPPQCDTTTTITRTYFQMDSTIESHYSVFADSLSTEMTPVGGVWRYIRQHYPSIELFTADESHPSQAGTYAAACSFYASVFRTDPANITYNYTLSATEAANIRQAVRQVIFLNQPKWNIGLFDDQLDSSCRNAVSVPADFWIVSPNPASDFVWINYGETQVQDKLRIFNSSGQLVKEIEVSGNVRLDVRLWAEGIYLISSEKKRQTIKLLKQ